MANVAAVLKAEISRISRKEVRTALKEIAKSNKILKKAVTDLKKKMALVEKDNKRLMVAERKRRPISPQPVTEGDRNARITSKGVRSLRSRLGLKRPDFARLCGTTAQTVYMWETKDGALKMRGNTRAALLAIRGLGAREAKKRLAEMASKKGKSA